MTILEVSYRFSAAALVCILQMLAVLMVDAKLTRSSIHSKKCGVPPALMPRPILTAFVCFFTHPIKIYTDDTSTC